ncbi:uncharacterized protein LOC122377553 [Amphibalanus amphitrite]|uniref:uncharacterized protein LOC122377553 n=1 Tax=Amphibalanus amphitrite TaxID=1232801 RepID=UPI001C913841|nr:uncharacterized protein LOC122377553 [Amphibalanus amphitrite]
MAAPAETLLVWVLLLTQVVPCPHPTSGHHACSVRRSYVARKIIESRWLPVVARYNVSLPLQCPLHPARLQYSHLPRRRHGQRWRCPVCGRQFSREVLVEYHHRAEHAAPPDRQDETLVCAADLCDILRCSVYSYVLTSSRADLESTELETVAPSAEARRAVQPARPRHLQKYSQARVLAATDRGQCARCVSSGPDGAERCSGRRPADNASLSRTEAWWWTPYAWWWVGDVTPPASDDVTAECEEEREEGDVEDPACDPSTMERLRKTCETLITNCVLPLILQLSPAEFRAMSEELSGATCWYLTCDRYWERSFVVHRALPWGSIVVALCLLTLLLCYFYYLLCFARGEKRPETGREFIQVKCPHELKRRLLERTVSREPARPSRPNDLFAIYDGDYELAAPNHVDY